MADARRPVLILVAVMLALTMASGLWASVALCGRAYAEEPPATGSEAAVATAADDDALEPQAEDAEADEKDDAQKEEEKKAAEAEKKKISTTVRFVGTDGLWAEVASLSLDEGSSAWDATRLALTNSGLAYKTGTTSAPDVLVSVTRLTDGMTQQLDPTTGSGWHLYLNGDRYLGSSSSLKLADGAQLEWRYEVGTFMVSVSVVGPGGTGASYWIVPTSVRMAANQTAWDASLEVFAQNGYGQGRLLSFTTADDGSVSLESLAALGENGITGEAWRLFVNGSMPTEDAAHIMLHAGDSICWYYAGRGEFELPPFVAESGGAAQNPATSVQIEGLVAQGSVDSQPSVNQAFAVIDRACGVSAVGSEVPFLVDEGKRLIDPLWQVADDTGWHTSLSYALNTKLSSGEGAGSVLGLDDSLYYVGTNGALVKLELR